MLFDPEFFPTPSAIIKKMVEPYAERLETATILEPSAGNGNILDFVTNNGIVRKLETSKGYIHEITVKAPLNNVYAIEKNPELQMILQGKYYRLIANDFLTFQPDTRFDLILMNPPFRNGDEHLLHAWDILHHGDIACLLNAETVRNPYTANRKLLAKIINDNGTVEELGKCFSDAENKTDVEVVLVKLHKEAKADEFTIDLDSFVKENAPDFGELAASEDAVMQSNRLDAFIRSWEMAKAAAINYIKAREVLQLYMGCFLTSSQKDKYGHSDDFRAKNVISSLNTNLDTNIGKPGHMQAAYNEFVSGAKSEAWNMIFQEIGLQKYMTSGLQEKLKHFINGQSSYAITKQNIMDLFNYIMLNLGTIMDQSVIEVYDRFTSYHKDNTVCKEGWKTNKQFFCNRKIILPDAVNAGFMPQKYGYDSKYRVEYYARLNDIDRAMCWLSGRNFDSLTGEIEIPGSGKVYCSENARIETVVGIIPVGDQSWYDSAFFRIRCFKKGTLHLEFKDEALWARFNQVVNDGKNQIGSGEAV